MNGSSAPIRGFRSTRNLGTLFLLEGPGTGGLVVLLGEATVRWLLASGQIPQWWMRAGTFSPEACPGAWIYF